MHVQAHAVGQAVRLEPGHREAAEDRGREIVRMGLQREGHLSGQGLDEAQLVAGEGLPQALVLEAEEPEEALAGHQGETQGAGELAQGVVGGFHRSKFSA